MNAITPRRPRRALTNSAEDLLGRPNAVPEGLRYYANPITAEEEESLARELAALPFEPFDFHGYKANRQVVGFGFRYDYGSRQVVDAPGCRPFSIPCDGKLPRRSAGRRNLSRRFSSTSIAPARASAGAGPHLNARASAVIHITHCFF